MTIEGQVEQDKPDLSVPEVSEFLASYVSSWFSDSTHEPSQQMLREWVNTYPEEQRTEALIAFGHVASYTIARLTRLPVEIVAGRPLSEQDRAFMKKWIKRLDTKIKFSHVDNAEHL